MYALVNFSGSQIKIEEGLNVRVPFQNVKIGSKVILDNVLFFDDGKKNRCYFFKLFFDILIFLFQV